MSSISQRVKELTDGQGVDVVFDCVGADVWHENTARPLKHEGRLVITGVTSGSQTPMDLSVLHGKPLHLMGSGGRSRRTMADAMKMVNQGALRGIVGRTFPLDAVAEAHQVDARPRLFRQARYRALIKTPSPLVGEGWGEGDVLL